MTLQETQQAINQRQEQLANQRQQVNKYESTIPQVTQRQLRGQIGMSQQINPLKAMQQRKVYSQAREKVGKAKEQITGYEEEVKQADKALKEYLTTDSGKMQYVQESGIKPSKTIYGKLGRGYASEPFAYVYDTPYGQVTDTSPEQKARYRDAKYEAKTSGFKSVKDMQESLEIAKAMGSNVYVTNTEKYIPINQAGVEQLNLQLNQELAGGKYDLKNINQRYGTNIKESDFKQEVMSTLPNLTEQNIRPESMQEAVETKRNLVPITGFFGMVSAESDNTNLNTSMGYSTDGNINVSSGILTGNNIRNNSQSYFGNILNRITSGFNKGVEKTQEITLGDQKFVSAERPVLGTPTFEVSGGEVVPKTTETYLTPIKMPVATETYISVAPSRNIFQKAENLFLNTFEKAFGGQNPREVVEFLLPNPNREVTFGNYPTFRQTTKDVIQLPGTFLADLIGPSASYLAGEGTKKAFKKFAPDFKGFDFYPGEKTGITGSYISSVPEQSFFERNLRNIGRKAGQSFLDVFGRSPQEVKFDILGDISTKKGYILTPEQIQKGVSFGAELGAVGGVYSIAPLVFDVGFISRGSQTILNPERTFEEKLGGAFEVGLGTFGLGFKGYKFGTKPTINRVELTDNFLVSPEFASNKGSRTIVSNRFREWFGLNAKYEGIPYGSGAGKYKDALKYLTNSGYTESQARQLLKLDKPKPLVNVFLSEDNIFKVGEVGDIFQYLLRGNINYRKISPFSGKPLKIDTRTVSSIYEIKDISKLGNIKFDYRGVNILGQGDDLFGRELFIRTKGSGISKPGSNEDKLFSIIASNQEVVGTAIYRDNAIKLSGKRVADIDKSLSFVRTTEKDASKEIRKVTSDIISFNSNRIINLGKSKSNIRVDKPSRNIIATDSIILDDALRISSIESKVNEKTVTSIIKSDINTLANNIDNALNIRNLIKEDTILEQKLSQTLKPTIGLFPVVSAEEIKVTEKVSRPSSITGMSIYTGTQEYELTNEVTNTPLQINIENIKQGSSLKIVSIPLLGQVKKSKEENKLGFISRLSDLQKTKLDNKLISKTATKQTNSQVTSNKVLSIPKVITPTRPEPKKSESSSKKNIFFNSNKLKKGNVRKEKYLPREEFLAITKRKGKEVVLGKFKTSQKAESVAKFDVLTRLSATAKVKTTKGRQVALTPDRIFRASKTDPLAIVQKKEARLSSRGERREIVKSKRGPLSLL